MKKISKNLIKKGIENGIISFDMEDDLLTAHIGGNYFFISDKDGKTERDFTQNQLVNMVYSSINDEPINDEDEEQAGEFLYYKAILEHSCQ